MSFGRNGDLQSAYSILSGTSTNCAGGPTPWNTWLSCEETSRGLVWECDPRGINPAVARPALGSFQHEAAAVDPVGRRIYLTEDRSDGRLYRFTPTIWPDLSAGLLEVSEALGSNLAGRTLRWYTVPIPNPTDAQTSTRYQVAESTPFAGGEGIWYHRGQMSFTTKGDNRVWTINLATGVLSLIYDVATSANPILSGVDNILIDGAGNRLIAEDGGDMQLVMITTSGEVLPVLQIIGQDGSELTGPAFSPDGTRLYISSQRGPSAGGGAGGLTYEISGPWGGDYIFGDGLEGSI